MNRIELESRGKIKSEIGYSQTSKHKDNGIFDFKGKYYDRDRDYVNHSRLYWNPSKGRLYWNISKGNT